MADTPSASDSKTWNAISIAAIVAILLRFLALISPWNRVWGLDYIRYAPLWVTVLTSGIILILLYPTVRSQIVEWYRSQSDGDYRNLYLATVAILCIAIIAFPMETFFLGDGGMFIGEVYRAVQTDGYVSTRLLDLKSAPLEGIVLYAVTYSLPSLAQGLGLESAAQPIFPFRIVALFAFITLSAAVYKIQPPKRRLPALLFILGSAGSLLFFGYVEMYVFVFAAAAVYALTAVRSIHGNTSKFVVVVVYIVAVLSHFSMAALLPGMLFLLFRNRIPDKFVSARNAVFAVLAGAGAFAALYFITGLHAADNRIVIPNVVIDTDTGVNAYTLLSAMHLLDFVNILVLMAPIPLAFLILYRSTDVAPETAVFYVLSIGYFAVFVFFANTLYGLGRDWDLAAPLGVLLALAAFHLLRVTKEYGSSKALFLSLLTVLYIIPWLAANISTDGAKNRMGYLLELDKGNISPYLSMVGYEALRKQYLHEKNYDRELEYLKKMIRLQDHPDSYRLMENALYSNFLHQPDTLASNNIWMLQRLDSLAGKIQANEFVYKWQNRKFIDSMVAGIGYDAYLHERIGPLQNHIAGLVEDRGMNTALFVLNGMEAYRQSDFPSAVYFLGRSAQSDFMTGKLAGMYGDALMQTGRAAQSDSVFTAAFDAFPDDAELRIVRAFSLIQKGLRPDEAREYLSQALGMHPDEQMRRTAEALLNRLPVVTSP